MLTSAAKASRAPATAATWPTERKLCGGSRISTMPTCPRTSVEIVTVRDASMTAMVQSDGTPQRRIRAVLWDFGGVITTSPFESFARYERENGLPADFIRGL